MAAFPPTEYSWWSRANVPFPDTGSWALIWKSWIFNFKTLLTNECVEGTASTSVTRSANSIWTVVSSSDGVSASAGDLWGNTFSGPNLVTGSSNIVPHSWIILENSHIGYHMLIDLIGAQGYARISFATASSPYISPLTTSPTGVLSWQNNTSDNTNNNQQFLADSTIGASRSHISINENGEFCYFSSRDGTNAFNTLTGFRKISSSMSKDNNFCSFNSPGGPSINMITSGFYGRTSTGEYKSGGGLLYTQRFGGSTMYNVASGSASEKYYVVSSHLSWVTPAYQHSGRIADFFVGNSNITMGASIPNTSSQTHISLSPYIIPMTDVTPITS